MAYFLEEKRISLLMRGWGDRQRFYNEDNFSTIHFVMKTLSQNWLLN